MINVGIDLGGTNIAVGVVKEGKIIGRHTTPTHKSNNFEVIITQMAKAVESALNSVKLTLQEVHSVGIGVPSTIDPNTNIATYANNLDWYNKDIVGALKKHLDTKIYIANDGDCAALGEFFYGDDDAGKHPMSLMLTLGTGIGGGVVYGGKIFLGGTKEGLELGHFVLNYEGEACTCGKNGCFEAYCSATALIRDTKQTLKAHPHSKLKEFLVNGEITAKTPFDAMQAGDEVAKALINRYINYLAEGIHTIVICLRPTEVIIGGGISNQGDNLILPLREAYKQIAFGKDEMRIPHIRKAKLKNDAGIIGAALLYKGI